MILVFFGLYNASFLYNLDCSSQFPIWNLSVFNADHVLGGGNWVKNTGPQKFTTDFTIIRILEKFLSVNPVDRLDLSTSRPELASLLMRDSRKIFYFFAPYSAIRELPAVDLSTMSSTHAKSCFVTRRRTVVHLISLCSDALVIQKFAYLFRGIKK